MNQPHGGKLVNRTLDPEARQHAAAEAETLPRLVVDSSRVADLGNIASGVYSPCTGFLGSEDLEAVISSSHLSSGIPWTIPIISDVADPSPYQSGSVVALYAAERPEPLALLHLEEIYRWDKRRTAQAVFGTTDDSHPGVARMMARGDYLLAGPIDLIDEGRGPSAHLNPRPAQTRALFAERGWQTICAFQTRNVPHAGHEHLQKSVLERVGGLLIQPVIGRKKPGDFTDEAIVAAYQALIESYFPPNRVLLSVLATEMHYAGPNEAIHHAIMRKNYGCTHIVIGRDHAGVGSYYGPEEAIARFADFPNLGIAPIAIREELWFCRRCRGIVSERTCSHPPSDRIEFSGTTIRQMIQEGTAPPAEILRPEVYQALRNVSHIFVS